MVIIRKITDEEFYAFPGPLAIVPYVPIQFINHHDQRPPLRSEWIDGTTIGLPHGWLMEKRPRSNEKYWGKIDKFYYQPKTNKQFRSKIAVEKYLRVNIAEESAPQALQQLGVEAEAPGNVNPNSDERPRKKRKTKAITGFLTVVEAMVPPVTLARFLARAPSLDTLAIVAVNLERDAQPFPGLVPNNPEALIVGPILGIPEAPYHQDVAIAPLDLGRYIQPIIAGPILDNPEAPNHQDVTIAPLDLGTDIQPLIAGPILDNPEAPNHQDFAIAPLDLGRDIQPLIAGPFLDYPEAPYDQPAIAPQIINIDHEKPLMDIETLSKIGPVEEIWDFLDNPNNP